jgi:hypothetical protein
LIQNHTSCREYNVLCTKPELSLRLLGAIAIGMLSKAEKRYTNFIAQKQFASSGAN